MKTLHAFISQIESGKVFGIYLPTEQYTSLSVFVDENGSIERVSTQNDVGANSTQIALSLARRADLLKDLGQDLDSTRIVYFIKSTDNNIYALA